MGNTSNSVQWNVKFIQNMDDQNFGNIDIYKNDEGKYIMMLKRTFMKDEKNQYSRDYGFHEILKANLEEKQMKEFLTPIMYSSAKIQNLCIVYEVIETYCEYFNFTLADMIKHKKQMDKDQLWMCFYWLVKFSVLLREKEWMMLDGINLRKIFITLKGMPTVSIHHLLKASTNDVVQQHEKTFIQEVGLCMLQLACMTFINENENLELYLRKTQKMDPLLGEILGNILRKSIKGRAKPTQKDIFNKIQKLLNEDKIQIAKQIKINKFKYVLAKPETNSVATHQTLKSKAKYSKQKEVAINNVQGRKNHETMNMRESSSKKANSDIFENNLSPLQRIPLRMPTPLNKTLSIKGSILMDQIQSKKRQIEKQKQKLSERRQLIMKNGAKSSMDKQNYLGNSIREVRPSYNRKESWSRRVMNEHLKQTNKR